MTLGNKLSKLRKENNITQEQLADMLGVSRQAISKWESDSAYPETEKLLRLGRLYNCSMDYLLKDEIEEQKDEGKTFSLADFLDNLYFERKSKKTLFGMPLWHINIGHARKAEGVFAVGLMAKGIVTLGVLSIGVVSLGCVSIGALAFGAIALGLLAAGAISAGVIAFGAICAGILAVGALSCGVFAVGAAANGYYLAYGDEVRAIFSNVGEHFAKGGGYHYLGDLSAFDKTELIAYMRDNVPLVFQWIVSILEKFL